MAEADLPAVHERLKAILAPHADRFAVREGDGGTVLELPEATGKPWGFVAGTRLGKRYVSFYLMAVYARPQLLDGMSPALRAHMQGKSCFNFNGVDDALLAELSALTDRVIDCHRQFVEPIIEARTRKR